MEEHAVTDEERLKKQMDFIRETDREKSVFRQTWLSDGSRKENDAEHSWHLALMAMLLSEYANESVNTEHVMAMVLIHMHTTRKEIKRSGREKSERHRGCFLFFQKIREKN